MVAAVCSARPRPSVQKGAKGHQWWKRDVWHIDRGDRRTMCGINASEWLTIGEIEINESCCVKCRQVYLAVHLPGEPARERRPVKGAERSVP